MYEDLHKLSLVLLDNAILREEEAPGPGSAVEAPTGPLSNEERNR